MSQTMRNLIRAAGFVAVMLAASCAGPGPDAGTSEDGAANHPITVEPSYKSIKLYYAPAGLSQDDSAKFQAFVHDYIEHGNGSIAVSAPSGVSANAAIAFFADRINELGVAKDHILVATHDVTSDDMRVELNYVAYEAHADDCGDWSDDLSYTLDNTTPKNFGCSVQHNIAAMVSDPRDLMGPRPMDGGDAARRATVVGHYEKGEVTQAAKHTGDAANEQSAPGASEVQ